jgi:hypothetical protein
MRRREFIAGLGAAVWPLVASVIGSPGGKPIFSGTAPMWTNYPGDRLLGVPARFTPPATAPTSQR